MGNIQIYDFISYLHLVFKNRNFSIRGWSKLLSNSRISETEAMVPQHKIMKKIYEVASKGVIEVIKGRT